MKNSKPIVFSFKKETFLFCGFNLKKIKAYQKYLWKQEAKNG